MTSGGATTQDSALAALAEGRHSDPFALLGPHETAGGSIVRTIQPAARAVELKVVATGELHPMRRLAGGIFELLLPDTPLPDYRLRITSGGGHVAEIDDPYRYGPQLSDFDIHLFAEGTHSRAYEKLGAHRVRAGSTTGVLFAVWAPNAHRVSVVGDFNGWDGRVHPMRRLVPSGVWEIFDSRPRRRREDTSSRF